MLITVFVLFSTVLALSLMDRARSDARSIVSALQQYAIRTMEVSALIADDAVSLVLARGDPAGLSRDEEVYRSIRALAGKLPPDSAVIVVDREGAVVLSSIEHPAPPLDLSDRAWFQQHAEGGFGRVVGRAIVSRVVPRKVFTFSQALTDANGQFIGAVNLGIPSDAVIGPNALPNYGEGVTLSIMRDDAYLVARNAFPDDLVEARLRLPDGYPEAADGTALMPSLGRGIMSVLSYASIPDYGLVAVASIPLVNVLTPLFYTLAGGLPILGMVLAGTYYLTRIAVRSFDDLERAAEANEVLLKEVHHRVKNNLQIISSLLQQQARRSGPEVAIHLEEATARVGAIALVHEQVYGGASPSDVDLAIYLQALAKNLKTTFGADGVELRFDMAPLPVTINDAVPLALITTEALSNAFKHAFSGGTGRLDLTLRTEGGRHRLTVTDNGVGIAETHSPNLGMNLIRALSRQLDATFGLRTEQGTVFWLEWQTRPQPVKS